MTESFKERLSKAIDDVFNELDSLSKEELQELIDEQLAKNPEGVETIRRALFIDE